ncbi:ankyrin repeat domain-containing protein [Swaminathania salitolerans]|uniref:Uncharacterized protein n=1 Tax=Swaminathania salitolerans TaxID=182838 RepID=A0A511BM21_9PROT|nr:ankyrin repeat domain-containing protein [Swaminathania salitolerans]GBQ15496.1 ankyrin-like protein [Swaminathania salitolerans LMG 21291]GEL01380.1 hypothetical protein SSA02_05430 [Swaminathania salitolerans]
MTEMMPAGSFSPEQITSLFIDAARRGDTDLLTRFLDAGMAVDAQDSRGYTALIVAAYNGVFPATRLLLERGANPDLQDAKGATALSGVAFKGHLAVAELLVDRGAALDIPSHLGRTPLMFAVMFGRVELVRFLLERGADPNQRDAEGLSVRDIAETHGQSHLLSAELTRQA